MIETEYQNIFVENTKIFKKTKTGRVIELCQWVDNVGYYQCSFRVNGKKHYVRVHRLIAKAYIPNPNNYTMINHIDGNKLNNNMNNLEWVTNQENRNHAIKNNLTKNLCGEEAPWSKLTKKDVIFIRSEYDKKETFNAKKLSKKFKVSTSQILLVAKRKSWKSV